MSDATGDRRPIRRDEPGRDDSAPATGRALFAWVKEQEARHRVGLLRYLNRWARLNGLGGRMLDFDAGQVAQAYDEACRKLRAVAR